MSRFTGFSEKSLKKCDQKYGRSMGSDAIALNFSKEIHFHAAFADIRFLKWRDVINSNSWFLAILKGFDFIQANIFFL